MSKRRTPGDVVWKKPLAGFVRPAGWGVVREPTVPWCPLECGDDGCVEWHEVAIYGDTKDIAEQRIAAGDKPIGIACHVSECEMLDAEDDTLPKTIQELDRS